MNVLYGQAMGVRFHPQTSNSSLERLPIQPEAGAMQLATMHMDMDEESELAGAERERERELLTETELKSSTSHGSIRAGGDVVLPQRDSRNPAGLSGPRVPVIGATKK